MPSDEKGPENMSDVLARLFASRGWGRRSERTRIEEAWAAAVGPELAGNTRVNAHRRGVLEIEVRNAVLIQELVQFHKRTLLIALRKLLPSTPITDLKFRAAKW